MVITFVKISAPPSLFQKLNISQHSGDPDKHELFSALTGLFENYLKIVILIKSENVDTKLEVNVDDYQLLQTRRKFKMMIRQEVEEVL